MKHVFLDTNILLDFAMEKREFHEEAVELFNLRFSDELKIYCSTHSIATLHYFIRKEINVTKHILESAVVSNFNDFEDAIQFFTAGSQNHVQFIITNDKSGFRNSTISVYSSQDFLKKYF
jgi:predicted nucleic acid-binding protein